MAANYVDFVRKRRARVDAMKGGGDDCGMAVRVARLESTVEHIQRDIKEIKEDIREFRKDMRVDFRVLFGALIATALSLAGVMAKGFHWL